MYGRERLGRYVDGAQLHILTYLGNGWGQGEPRLSDEFVVGYTKDVNRDEGVVTYDVPTSREGLIPEPVMAQLRALRSATR